MCLQPANGDTSSLRTASHSKWSGGVDNCNFRLVSFNVNGIATDKTKRIAAFEYLKEKGDIIFMQETHSTPETEKKWRKECDCESFFSHGKSNAGGVMIFVKNTLEFKVIEKISDAEGRFLLLKCIIQGVNFLLYNIYAPNKELDHKTFINYINTQISAINTEEYDYIIGAGDWNFTSEDIDRKGGNYTKWKNNINILDEITEKTNIVDIWRIRNPDIARYSWRGKVRNHLIQSRIDRIYISDALQYNVSKTDILTGINSDHSITLLELKPTNTSNTGPSFWRFNNSLLKNKKFTDGLIDYIETDIVNECTEIKSDQLKWEYTKYKMKGWSMKESKTIAREKRKTEEDVTTTIKSLEEKVALYNNEKDWEELETNKTKLEKICNAKTQSLIIQSRVQIYEEGEKSTAFFLNQIKQNKIKSTIRKLMDDKTELVDQSSIMNKLNDFYSKLYTKDKKCKTGNWIKNLRSNGLVPQLSEVENEKLEAPLDVTELKEMLEKCANNKSPGNDGLTKEFYLFFWDVIHKTLFNSYLESIKVGKLTVSQRQNLISLIEKTGKDKTLIKNWRPISLINFDTKLLSKTYAERLKNVMPTLVHPNQVAYVKNRFIGEGLRTIDETMQYTKRKNIEAYAIAVDFEKAFDSIDWNYLWEALESFNIPKSFIDMIKLLYNDIESCVTNNGTSTTYFKVTRGVRQGDPIAAYLFTLAIELLAISIRNNKNIIGIKINDTEIKLSLYADDLTGLIVGINSIKELMKLINDFKNYSGLGVNTDKTELMALGCSNNTDITELGYKIVNEMKITGITFTYNQEIFIEQNYNETLKNIEITLNIWKQRNLSILGKVQIIKTLGISTLLFICNMCLIPLNIIKNANSIFSKFLWNGPNKMKELSAIGDIENGGIKMPHLESIVQSLRVVWVKRYSTNNYHPWKEFLIESLGKTGSHNIINRKIPNLILDNSEMSQFNKEIITSWNKVQTLPDEPGNIAYQNIWNNEYICKPNKVTINYPSLVKSGINHVKDLITNGKIITICDITLRETCWKKKFELTSTILCLPKSWKNTNFNTNKHIDIEEYKTNLEKITNNLTTKKVYKKIIEKLMTPPTSELFLSTLLDIPCSTIKEYYSIPFTSTIYTKLRSFQFKIIHNIFYTNEKLHRIGYSNTPYCTFCNNETETLLHLFVECVKVRPLWKKIIDELLPPYGINALSSKDILLGIILEKENNVINHIIIEAKYHIHVCRLEKTLPVYNRLINRLKITESIEKEIASKTQKKTTTHNHKWHHLIQYILAI